MNATKRTRGKMVRRIAKLDRSWKAEGKQEGRTENALCWRMGQAIRAGVPAARIERARRSNG